MKKNVTLLMARTIKHPLARTMDLMRKRKQILWVRRSMKRGRSLSLRRKKQEKGALTMEHFQKKVVTHLKIMEYIFFSFFQTLSLLFLDGYFF